MPATLQAGEGSDDRLTLLAYNGSDASVATLLDGKKKKNNYGMWLNASGLWGDQDPGDGYDGFDYDSQSLSSGLDALFGEKVLVGMGLGYTQTDLNVDDDLGDGAIDSLHVSAYGTYFTDRYYFDGTLSYGRHNYDNTRKYEAFSVHRNVTSDHDGESWSAHGEGGYTFKLNKWVAQPFVALSYIYLSEDGFEENGADELSLNVKKRSTDSLVSDLGARLSRSYKVSFGTFVPELSGSWNYDFGIDDRVIESSFSGFPSAAFSIDGREEEKSGFIFGVGLNFIGTSGLSSSLRYSEELRSDYKVRGVMGELRLEF
jgi:outer membrane autotransporter protein